MYFIYNWKTFRTILMGLGILAQTHCTMMFEKYFQINKILLSAVNLVGLVISLGHVDLQDPKLLNSS